MCIAASVSVGKYEKMSIMVLKDLKKMSISAKTMSLMVASLFAVDGCTGYTIQVSVCCTMVYKGMIVILVLAFGPAPVI